MKAVIPRKENTETQRTPPPPPSELPGPMQDPEEPLQPAKAG